ncbi:MAG: CDP-alcohol phosphatidyltransferase family protein [Kocuria sp.]|nr:CDP-alcohol phosphatidyltransferase family protein [Kocuria sp.]
MTVAHRLTFTDAYEQLRRAQKPGAGVPAYTRWVNRSLARYAAAFLASRGVSADGTTALSATFSAVGLLLLALGPISWWTGLAVAVLFAIGYVLDSADGQVARLTGTGSPAGEWLDHVVDAIRTPAIHLCALVSWYRHEPLRDDVSTWMLALPVVFTLVAVGHFMSQILAEQLLRARGVRTNVASDAGPVRSFVNLPMDAGVTCWIFILWGAPLVFVAAYALLLIAHIGIGAVSMRRKRRALHALKNQETTA